jgi:uncharacterized repeat protein (TIGR01451 family)
MRVPNDQTTFEVEAYSVDGNGNASPVVSRIFNVDTTPPEIVFSVSPVMTDLLVPLRGTTRDPAPPDAQVARVEVQVDEDTPWLVAEGPYEPVDGWQGWSLVWGTPSEDGVMHRLRARATDAAGNISLSEWQATLVDNIAPVVTVTTAISQVELVDYWPGHMTGGPVLAGTVSDGGGLSGVRVRVDTPAGDSYQDGADLDGDAWSYIPHPQAFGLHRLYVMAQDLAGNISMVGPFNLSVTTQVVLAVNKTVSNDAPGEGDLFTYTIQATNQGPSTATNVTVSDILADDLRLAGQVTREPPGDGIVGAPPFLLSDATLGVGESITMTLPVKVVDGFGQSIANTVSVTSAENPMPTTADVTISATNVAPKVGSITAPAEPVVVGTVVNASAPFSDPGRMDRHTAVWDWGDGTTTSPATVTQGAGSGSVKDHHTYMRSGRFTIRLTVTDDDGGKGSATHTLTVLSPSKAIESLIDRVEGLNLPRGIQNELTSKLSNALDDLGRGRDQGAVGKLNAFVNSVKAQRGKKISAAEADALIQTAQGIINAIKAGLR